MILILSAPLFQWVDGYTSDEEYDGKKIYGDNCIFRKILGVKTEYYNMVSNEELDNYEYSKITPAPWMKVLGVKEEVKYNFIYLNTGESFSPVKDVILIIIIRWVIKLAPLIILLISLSTSTKVDNEEAQFD